MIGGPCSHNCTAHCTRAHTSTQTLTPGFALSGTWALGLVSPDSGFLQPVPVLASFPPHLTLPSFLPRQVPKPAQPVTFACTQLSACVLCLSRSPAPVSRASTYSCIATTHTYTPTTLSARPSSSALHPSQLASVRRVLVDVASIQEGRRLTVSGS